MEPRSDARHDGRMSEADAPRRNAGPLVLLAALAVGGVIASLVETCKLNALDPRAYLASTLTRLINRHPASQIDQLMPWAYANQVA